MKWNQKSKGFPALIAVLGVVTCLLRFALYGTGLDEKNLLIPGHVLSIGIWVSAAAALVVIALGMGRTGWREEEYRRSIPGALGMLLMGAAIGAAVYFQGMPLTPVEKAGSVVGMLCVPGMVYGALCRIMGRRPFFVCHGLVCVYFALYLVANYQSWSGNPQLQDYVFAMLACVALALFAYQQTAFDVASGNGGAQNFTGLLAVYFGIAALCRAESPWLFLAGSLWALTNLSHPAQAPWYRHAKGGD